MKTIAVSLFALLGLVAGCSGSDDKIDIGDRNVTEVGAKLTDYAGTWDGYAEAYEFKSGSDRVRITLDGAGNGTVEFGDVPPLVMSNNPEIGFPPVDWDTELVSISGLQMGEGAVPLKEGFNYTVADSSLTERRFRFGVAMGEIIAPWCALQTSYEAHNWSPTTYLCAPSPSPYPPSCTVSELQGGTVVSEPADCDWAARCYFQHCTCTASGCAANPELGTASFDATLENGGADLVGTLSIPAPVRGSQSTTTKTRLTVRLTRTP